MKISIKDLHELGNSDEFINENRFQKFRSKKRDLSSKKLPQELTGGREISGSFRESDIESLIFDGLVDTISGIIKSGKEASVYLAKCREEHFALKVYKDIRVRSFRKDEMYREGRFIGEKRLEKAIQQGSEFGLDAHQIIWVGVEYRQMTLLHENGISVPRPIALSGLAILMEYICDEDGSPAPRISDADLSRDEAQDAFEQSVKILEEILDLGRVHGDFSAFNLLWSKGTVYAIDFPQMIIADENPRHLEILERDIVSLCRSFRRKGASTDERALIERLVK